MEFNRGHALKNLFNFIWLFLGYSFWKRWIKCWVAQLQRFKSQLVHCDCLTERQLKNFCPPGKNNFICIFFNLLKYKFKNKFQFLYTFILRFYFYVITVNSESAVNAPNGVLAYKLLFQLSKSYFYFYFIFTYFWPREAKLSRS